MNKYLLTLMVLKGTETIIKNHFLEISETLKPENLTEVIENEIENNEADDAAVTFIYKFED